MPSSSCSPSCSQAPPDVCLLLRADAEQRWLHREVIPVLCELEEHEPAEERPGAALAYLEAVWGEATIRAHAADAARGELGHAEDDDGALRGLAARYHAAVRVLRELVSARVRSFVSLAASREEGHEPSQGLLGDAPAVNGCAPRAA
jgi:hypothetical protein